MVEVLRELIRGMTGVLQTGANSGTMEVQIASVIAAGLFFVITIVTVLIFTNGLVTIGRIGMTGMSNFVTQFGIGSNNLMTSAGKTLESTTTWIPAMVQANKEIEIARIEALTESASITLKNGDKSIELDLNGPRTSPLAESILAQLAAPAEYVYRYNGHLIAPEEGKRPVIDVRAQSSQGMSKYMPFAKPKK